ncbi:hypothetical protein [Amycolatopsis sp. MtRt-6]|uniref:hypothetical protein n=1 Tax=Amycolatopsis sp. MtRt-6 TaxID=2792782 RepID=UPI001A909FBE|nr:hypothetical protein [Amycolatopsis sp. MtRt-6]
MIKSVETFAGQDPQLSTVNLLAHREWHNDVDFVPMVIACKRGTRDCLLVAPDGAGYHSLEEFVDDTTLLKPGDRVSGPSGLPDAPDNARVEELTKSDPTAAPWIVVGFAVVGCWR